ncbi:MAG: glycosyltransferase [Alphaproteobacteria bacterium]|jgi:ubiquinone/menaquinone biosynthesis C-methylase UbiE|nr:glycosyltransferase [Alphaproteobacteria bacterium]
MTWPMTFAQNAPSLPNRKQQIIDSIDQNFDKIKEFTIFNRKFHRQDQEYHQFLIEPQLKVLEIGCGNGDLLASVAPRVGVGIDISPKIIDYAKTRHPTFTFFTHDAEAAYTKLKDQTFDVVIISDVIGFFDDIQLALENLAPLCTPDTRIIISYYTKHWEFMVKFAELLGIKVAQPPQNFLSTVDIEKLAELSGFELIRKEYQQLIPISLLGIDTVINKFIATLPGIRKLCLRTYVVARPRPTYVPKTFSTTVVIPCRNEKGNIEPAIQRLPQFCDDMEIIFVEGHSGDGTWKEVLRVKDAYPHLDIKAFQQTGKGKADAVHLGFEKARGELLMILDADLTVPPEQLHKFYRVISSGQGEFVNGTRLIYPMEDQAMRFFNFIANKAFSWIFSYLLSQRFTDTLCGTKVFLAKDYKRIIEQRKFFGNFDPFGDFELIFGASKLNLKVIEVPIRYEARSYGSTQISRWRHGVILLKMVMHAYKKLKLFF